MDSSSETSFSAPSLSSTSDSQTTQPRNVTAVTPPKRPRSQSTDTSVSTTKSHISRPPIS